MFLIAKNKVIIDLDSDEDFDKESKEEDFVLSDASSIKTQTSPK